MGEGDAKVENGVVLGSWELLKVTGYNIIRQSAYEFSY